MHTYTHHKWSAVTRPTLAARSLNRKKKDMQFCITQPRITSELVTGEEISCINTDFIILERLCVREDRWGGLHCKPQKLKSNRKDMSIVHILLYPALAVLKELLHMHRDVWTDKTYESHLTRQKTKSCSQDAHMTKTAGKICLLHKKPMEDLHIVGTLGKLEHVNTFLSTVHPEATGRHQVRLLQLSNKRIKTSKI